MREILFRGKRVDNGEWIFGHLAENKVIGASIVCMETVGQYTGWKDKGGAKIFEGDVIKANKEFWEIRFFEGSFYCFSLNKKHNTVFPKSMRNIKIMKIKGNIHDNPKILNQTK